MNKLTPEIENFFLSWSLRAGPPKGLGAGQLRNSTLVGAKTPSLGPPDEPSPSYLMDFSAAAAHAGVIVANYSGLYQQYKKWYAEQ